MSLELYTEIVDALTYALHASASRRSPNYALSLIETRDEFVRMFPDHRDAYVPAGER